MGQLRAKITAGIISMHKVINFGSAIQLYALVQLLRSIDVNPLIIDYSFPNSFQDSRKKQKCILKKIFNRNLFRNIRSKIALRNKKKWSKQRELFQTFWDKNFTLSRNYPTRESLLNSPPNIDIAITGSDQVWNPKHTCGDPAFFCDFAKGLPKISYAASFSLSELPDEYKNSYSKLLSEYQYLSVREQSGVNIIYDLIGKNAKLVCDPSLLIKKNRYIELSKETTLKIKGPYILAYILDYNYNPHPTIEKIINKIRKEKGLRVVYLQCGGIHGNSRGDNMMIFDAGPVEFISLILNADCVVTSSFHGMAISSVLETNFYAVVSDECNDDRISSLGLKLGLNNRIIKRGTDINDLQLESINWNKVRDNLDSFRLESINFLINSIKSAIK